MKLAVDTTGNCSKLYQYIICTTNGPDWSISNPLSACQKSYAPSPHVA